MKRSGMTETAQEKKHVLVSNNFLPHKFLPCPVNVHEACDVLPEVKRLETVSVTSNKGTMLVTVAGWN
jgi:hypothetical protein